MARMENVPYREVVGSLMWTAIGTRPDIAFAVGVVSQFLDDPTSGEGVASVSLLAGYKGT
jgi:hypothetical protein